MLWCSQSPQHGCVKKYFSRMGQQATRSLQSSETKDLGSTKKASPSKTSKQNQKFWTDKRTMVARQTIHLSQKQKGDPDRDRCRGTSTLHAADWSEHYERQESSPCNDSQDKSRFEGSYWRRTWLQQSTYWTRQGYGTLPYPDQLLRHQGPVRS